MDRELICLLVMLAVFLAANLLVKLPVSLSMVLGAVAGALTGGQGIPLRHMFEGTFTYLDTIHYLDEKSGEYRLINNRLIQDGDRLYNKDNPTLRVELTPEYISLRDTKGAGLSWHLEGAKPCPPRATELEAKEELDQIRSSAVYEEILPGADLRCEISGVHFKDEIIFHTPESTEKAVFELRIRELSPRQEGEDILLTDAAGETIFILPEFLWDMQFRIICIHSLMNM